MEMKKRSKIVLLAGLTLLLLFVGVFSFEIRSEAKSQSVTSGKGGWNWTFWGNSEEGDEEQKLRYARITNRSTGEYLRGGWHLVDDNWYFFTPSGVARDQFHQGYAIGDRMGLGSYEAGTKMKRYQWVIVDSHWRYARTDGYTYLRNRAAWIDNGLYLFDENGYAPRPGWYQSERTGAWYYIKKNRSCAVGWQQIGKKWFFFDYCTGQMAELGSYDTSSPFAKAKKYYIFTSSGAMRSGAGWVKDADGAWYLSGADGRACTGWKTIGGKDYYFEPALGGRMAASTDELQWYQGGRPIGSAGTAGKKKYAWHTYAGKFWYGVPKDYVKGTRAIINGWAYEFNEKGYCVRGVRLSDMHEQEYIHEKDDLVVRWDQPVNYTEQELYLMAATVYLEAGGEDYKGQVAVANVILNRLRSGKHGKSISDVIYQPYQFSVVGTKTFRRCLITGGSSTSLKAAKEALMGKNMIGDYDSFRMHEGYDLKKIKTQYIIHGCHVFYFEW